jgi:hypothetical protein
MADQRTRTRDRRLRRVNQITAAGLIGGAALTGVLSKVAAHSYSGASDPAAEEPAPVVPEPTSATPAPTSTQATTRTTQPVWTTTQPTTTHPATTQPQLTTPTVRHKHGAVSGGS